MSNLSLHIRVPELDEDEFFSTSFLFHLAKNNVRILWNVVDFYFQDSTKSSEQVQDVIRITDLLENFYSEFFYYEMEVRFIDEPLEIESLIRGHLKGVVMINDCFNDFLGNGKPNNEVKTALLGLQAVLDMVVKSYSVYVPELFVMQYKHEKTPFEDKTNNSTHPLLSERQELIIKKLIERGFSDVHVYRFLKDEKQFITITESQFVTFMNKSYNRNYAKKKRFSSIKDITIPVELEMYFSQIIV